MRLRRLSELELRSSSAAKTKGNKLTAGQPIYVNLDNIWYPTLMQPHQGHLKFTRVQTHHVWPVLTVPKSHLGQAGCIFTHVPKAAMVCVYKANVAMNAD